MLEMNATRVVGPKIFFFPPFLPEGTVSLPWRGSCCLGQIQHYLGTEDLEDGEQVLDAVDVGKPEAGHGESLRKNGLSPLAEFPVL